MRTIAVLATGVLVGTFAFECTGLTSAIERLTEATRQSNAVALRQPPPPTRASAAATVPPVVPSPPVALFPWAIVRESDTEYLLDRRLLDLVLEDQANLMKSVRVVPSTAHGKTYPRLFGARSDSLLGMLGFRDGDLLESINGFDLSTPERALEAYARLRSADVLEARVSRGGRIVTLLYRLL
jgi:general secretion pathway protein C